MSQQGTDESPAAGSGRDLANFFVAGGPVQPGRGCYVRRAADRELARLVRAGEYVQVLAPRHMGKSSLMARLADELREEGHHVAVVDLTQLGARERPDDLGRWFYSFAFRLIRQLRLRVDLQVWWQDKAVLTNRQRLTELYWDLILNNTTGPVTVFIDELQCLDSFPGAEQLLASIRAAHNARAAEPALARLNFVMLGVHVPEDFDADSEISPFPVSQSVVLRDFRSHQIDAFGPALGLSRPQASVALERIHFWTGGQPYLTQKLARALARARMRNADLSDPAFIVDALIYRLYLNPSSLQNEPHLSYLHHELTAERKERDEILTIYGRVRKGGRVIVDPESAAQQRLISHGVLVATRAGTLAVRNRIYHQIFTARWANEQLPFQWRRVGVIAALVALMFLVPIWYTQYLPRPWTRVLASSTSTLEEARDAYATLSRIPGHGATADRMFLDFLSRMSRGAKDIAAVESADRLLRTLSGAEPLADQLAADFWDRQGMDAEFRHERDAALLARLRALVVPTVDRRRRAAALVGEDYRLLAATMRVPEGFEQAVVASDGRRLLAASGNSIYGWRIDRLPPEPMNSWQATALRFRPAVSRRVLTADGKAGMQLRLTADIDHDRPFDLLITLTGPSGRSASFEPQFGAAADATYEFGADGDAVLAPLAGEPRGGTWTLTVTDRVQGVTGRLLGWSLHFGNFEPGREQPSAALALEDPVPEQDSRLYLGPAGRYALAIPPAGEAAARVWDLESRSPVSTLPVSQEDRVIGFVLDQRVVLVHGVAGIGAWTLSTGDPTALAGVGKQAALSALSPDGDVLAIFGGGEGAAVEAFDLIEGTSLGTTAARVAHSALAVSRKGELIAVADPDRAVRIWRIGDEQPLAELDPQSQPLSLSFSPRADQLSIRLADGGLMLWRRDGSGSKLRHYSGSGPWHAAFDPSSGSTLIGTAGHGFRLLDESLRTTDMPLLRHGAVPGAELWVAHRRDHGIAMSGDPAAGWLRLWRLPAIHDARADPVTSPGSVVRLTADGHRMAIGALNGSVRIVRVGPDAVETRPVGERVGFFGHAKPVSRLAFSGDASILASTAEDGSLRVWETSTAEPRDFMAFQPTADPITRLAVGESGEHVVTTTGTHLRLWDAANGALLIEQRLGQPVTGIVALPGDGGFLFGDAAGMLWQLPPGLDRIERIHEAGSTITALAVAPAGDLVAIGSASGTLQLVDLEARQLKGSSDTLNGSADALVFADDGDHLLVRSGQWLHRYRRSAYLLLPQTSRLLPATRVRTDFAVAGGEKHVVTLLAGHGVPRAYTLDMELSDVPPLVGDTEALLEQWRQRLLAAPGVH